MHATVYVLPLIYICIKKPYNAGHLNIIRERKRKGEREREHNCVVNYQHYIAYCSISGWLNREKNHLSWILMPCRDSSKNYVLLSILLISSGQDNHLVPLYSQLPILYCVGMIVLLCKVCGEAKLIVIFYYFAKNGIHKIKH